MRSDTESVTREEVIKLSCYHPNKGFIVGVKPNGKFDMKFCSYRVEYIWSDDPSFRKFHRSFEPLAPYVSDCLEMYDDYILYDAANGIDSVFYCVKSVHIPCGQCIGCRIDKSKEWANRMLMEASYYERNCFLTLTYDDFNIPKASYSSPKDGLVHTSYTLRKKDLQRFMKRLRRAISVYGDDGKVIEETKIRFYACGEYGTQSMRPHYHLIIFNWFPEDAKFLRHHYNGYNFYTSELISELWPYGFHIVTFLTWETCAYTARYVTKKLGNKDRDIYDVLNIEPEFTVMSRKPGLARQYYEDHKLDIYDVDTSYIIRLNNGKNVIKSKPPRYFDNLFDVENPERLAEIKQTQIEIAQNVVDLKLTKTDKNYFELLADEEADFKSSVKKLRRL